jgi:mono/diheme cytochrome c family protein
MMRRGSRAWLIAALAVVDAVPAWAQVPPPDKPVRSAAAPSRTAAATDGAGLFQRKCGYCHLAGGTGTMMLARRLGPANGLLADRRDIPADYVRTVVRNGIGSMPALTRVEVEDQQLGTIATWLAAGARRNRAGKR